MERASKGGYELWVPLLLLIVFLFLLVTASLSTWSRRSMMHGMMGDSDSLAEPGPWDYALIVVALAGVVGSVFLILWQISGRHEVAFAQLPQPSIAGTDLTRDLGSAPEEVRPPEAAVVRVLEEDERRLYTLIRERGGEMLQRDIVSLNAFSKAKVTRLLDKLERKGLVTRERYGATNKVRLTMVK